MQKMFAEGKKVHDIFVKIMFDIERSNPNFSHFKKAEKIAVFGRGYGGGIRGIYERVSAKVPEFNFTMAQFRIADRKFFAMFPNLAKGMDEASKKALATRTSVTATGRKRFYLGTPEEVKREGINTPIQGTAGDIENESLIDLYAECLLHDDWRLCNSVHDSNIVECPIADVPLCANRMKAIMEKPRKLWNKTVIFPADISVSTKSWGEMLDYEDWIKEQTKTKVRKAPKRSTSSRKQ
jgi:DNA polymerase I-like protein with 3'-5' exonuclease and polymerase domains